MVVKPTWTQALQHGVARSVLVAGAFSTTVPFAAGCGAATGPEVDEAGASSGGVTPPPLKGPCDDVDVNTIVINQPGLTNGEEIITNGDNWTSKYGADGQCVANNLNFGAPAFAAVCIPSIANITGYPILLKGSAQCDAGEGTHFNVTKSITGPDGTMEALEASWIAKCAPVNSPVKPLPPDGQSKGSGHLCFAAGRE